MNDWWPSEENPPQSQVASKESSKESSDDDSEEDMEEDEEEETWPVDSIVDKREKKGKTRL